MSFLFFPDSTSPPLSPPVLVGSIGGPSRIRPAPVLQGAAIPAPKAVFAQPLSGIDPAEPNYEQIFDLLSILSRLSRQPLEDEMGADSKPKRSG